MRVAVGGTSKKDQIGFFDLFYCIPFEGFQAAVRNLRWPTEKGVISREVASMDIL